MQCFGELGVSWYAVFWGVRSLMACSGLGIMWFSCDHGDVCAGGNGYINDYPTGRFLRDAKLYEIGAGTSEVRRIVIGRAFNKMFKD